MTKINRQEALAQEAREKMSKPILNYDEQAARIRVLEAALIASEQDYEKLLKERGATVDDAWQKYCEEIMPQKTAHIYPLAGAMYKTFVTGWNAALKEKK
jgi:hypothetical protein